MFFGGSPFEQFAGMHGGEGGGGGGGGGGRRGPAADVDTTELYRILGIEKDASENDIKKAYRKLALKVKRQARCRSVHPSPLSVSFKLSCDGRATLPEDTFFRRG